MLIHQPTNEERVVWYGGESTQLHYERLCDGKWKELSVRTLNDFPHSVKAFKAELDDFYQYCAEEYYA
jgi:hypothetical protein